MPYIRTFETFVQNDIIPTREENGIKRLRVKKVSIRDINGGERQKVVRFGA